MTTFITEAQQRLDRTLHAEPEDASQDIAIAQVYVLLRSPRPSMVPGADIGILRADLNLARGF
jgi:hypothetical protein